MELCSYCGSKVDKNFCGSCLSSFRVNYELLIILAFFFALPSIFIVKGTGNYLYLLTSLVGVLIYFFNIKMIRDDEATFRSYSSVLKEYTAVEKYLSKNEVGILELMYISEYIKSSLIHEGLAGKDVYGLLSSFVASISKPSIDSQEDMIGIDGEQLNAVVVTRKALLLEKLERFKRYHSDLILKFS